jgi:hypothetical protein
VNTGEPWPDPFWAERRVQRMQAKLHQWAAGDPGRRFDDLYNLIHHPDFLSVAWERVRGNTTRQNQTESPWHARVSCLPTVWTVMSL